MLEIGLWLVGAILARQDQRENIARVETQYYMQRVWSINTQASGSILNSISLRLLCVLRVSAVGVVKPNIHRRDTEVTEAGQRKTEIRILRRRVETHFYFTRGSIFTTSGCVSVFPATVNLTVYIPGSAN